MTYSLTGALFAVFIPGQCRLCERDLNGFSAVPVCSDCLDSLRPAHLTSVCPRCGQSLRTLHPVDSAQSCRRCRLSPPPFDAASSFGTYEGNLRRLIHLLKYERMVPLSEPLAERLAAVLPRLGPIDLIVPVPLYWTRRWLRGFNQSALLAKRLARHTGIAYGPRALRRVRRTRAQAGLSDQERIRNMRGAFRATSPRGLAGRRVLLLDDVMTTGATLAAAAAALKAAGVSYVGALTVARAERGDGGSQLELPGG